MPVWLLSLVGWLGPKITHSIWRFVSVVVVAAILIGGPIFVYRHIYNGAYNKGWKEGYSKSLKDNPPMVITGGTTTINNDGKDKEPFFLLKIWKMRLSV